jgi:hypothetical protein
MSAVRGDQPSISIVTPNFNGFGYLADAIESVVSQDYPNLQYVIADGGSTDGSQLIIGQYNERINAVISGPDRGHADALNKGFALTDGEIMGWINSDDILHPGCLERIARIFGAYPDVEWITGRPTAMNAGGEIDYVGDVRPWSRLRFLAGDHLWIQQESTFWRRSLWDRAGGGLDLDFNVANDFELWARFFRHAPLYSVDHLLGCFRVRPGQRSVAQRADYEREVDQILRRELKLLEPAWREAWAELVPATPRTLDDSEKAALEPGLRKYDPPIIHLGLEIKGNAPKGGGPRFDAKGRPPEPASDLTVFKDRHAGERCFILGNGPSLNETDLSLLNGETVFACNAVFLLFDRIEWRPAYYTCVDSQVLPDRAEQIVEMLRSEPDMTAFFPAELTVHGEGDRIATRSYIPDLERAFFFNEEAGGVDKLPWSMFSTDAQAGVVQPHTVAITMLQLAAYMGFSEIYLVGCDTRYTVPVDVQRIGGSAPADPRIVSTSADPNHFDPDYFGPGRRWHVPQVQFMQEHYRIARTALEALGVVVKNATVGGDLEVFERTSLQAVKAGPPPQSHRRPTAIKDDAPTRRAPDPRLTGLGVAAVTLRNNLSVLALGTVILVAAGALAVLAPQWRIWIAIAAAAAAPSFALAALAIKVRRIIFNLNAQIQRLESQNARVELAVELQREKLSRSRDSGPADR